MTRGPAPAARIVSHKVSAGGAEVTVQSRVIKSAPGPEGVQTILNLQTVGAARYFDAAGFEGKTVGLKPQ